MKIGNGKTHEPSILITAAHHSRELGTISMAFYTALRMLYEHAQEQVVESNSKKMLTDFF